MNLKMRAWAFVPARGGSKSIPRKNLVLLGGVPMLDYGVKAALATQRFERIICSTDDAEIGERARFLGIEIDRRPAELAGDEAAVADVAREFLRRYPEQERPAVLVLIQPTSPFLLADHINELLDRLAADPEANSGQTICRMPHNHHAWNQRVLEGGHARFKFAQERRQAFNKQSKPKLHIFGNLVAVRPAALLAGQDFFAEPSAAVEIAWPYDLDVDAPQDLRLAEALLETGVVRIPKYPC